MNSKNKLIYSVICLIIVVGTIVALSAGFNVEKNYKHNQKIEIDLGREVELDKISQITDEVFGKNKATVQIVEIYNESVQISAVEISEEQKNNVVEKINNLYKAENATETQISSETENIEDQVHTEDTQTEVAQTSESLIDASTVKIITIGDVKVWDVVKPYIFPIIITLIVTLVYVAVKNWKNDGIKKVLTLVISAIVAELTLFALFAIVRFPIGTFTPVLMLATFVLTVWCKNRD